MGLGFMFTQVFFLLESLVAFLTFKRLLKLEQKALFPLFRTLYNLIRFKLNHIIITDSDMKIFFWFINLKEHNYLRIII